VDFGQREYKSRLVDGTLSKLLRAFGGVLITGPKWCGKSWTAAHQAKSTVFVDEKQNRERALLLPDAVLEGETPRLIDEWQDAPVLWDAARRQIDRRHAPGQFIFTGSAVPPAEATSHTGTGRFARLRMRPLSLFESGDSNGKVSLAGLFRTGRIEPCISEMDFRRALRLICKGGWPASFWVDEDAAMLIAREYVKAIAEQDISRADGVRKDAGKVALFLRSLARNTATAVKFATLRGDVGAAENSVSEQSIRAYYEALRAIFAVEEQEAWQPSLRSKTRIRTSPKRHFADPSLAAAALGATPDMLAEDIRTAGFLFESLCFRDLSVYAETLGGKVFHYRDETDFEIDAIVQDASGSYGLIEVKLGTFEFDAAAANLTKFVRKLAPDATPPAFLAILTASGGTAYTRDDGVCVVPVDCLGP